MSPEPLDVLVQQLARGDLAAAEQLFRVYEPYLRLVVRRALPRRLRTKFDSLDVVQSVWVEILRGLKAADWHFRDAVHLRSFLVTLTRHRLIDRARQHRVMLQREEPPGGTSPESLADRRQPRPSEVAQAEELWNRMLALCPPAHQEVLHLRRQGLLLKDIAERTGMHEGSIRRILRQLARQLALRPEAGEGENGES